MPYACPTGGHSRGFTCWFYRDHGLIRSALNPVFRRHYVAWSSLTKENFPESYWRDLHAWYAHGGIGHVGAYLANMNLSGFDPKAPPPKTTAFWDIVDAKRARTRLANEQAQKTGLENARRRGELILASEVNEVMCGMAADVSSRLDGLGGRLANELAGITDPAVIRERILTETHAIRSGVAEYSEKLADQCEGEGAHRVPVQKSSAKAHAKRAKR